MREALKMWLIRDLTNYHNSPHKVYISTQPKELYLCGNSSSTNIKTEISDKTEELQSDLTFLCDSELELDQIPIF